MTTIKRIENRSSSPLRVVVVNWLNLITPTGSNVLIGSGSSIEADFGIPLANQQDFSTNRLEIQLSGRTRYWVWQAPDGNRNFIRFSTDGLWHHPGEKAHGFPLVAKDIFEVAGDVLSGKWQSLIDLVLGERALVVLDSHFETIPIAPKTIQIPTNIKRIKNLTSKSVVLFKKAEGKYTSSAIVPPSDESVAVNMQIPSADENAFANNRLELRIDGQTRYWIWQSKSDLDGDYIRFNTIESFTPIARRVNGIPATGISHADLVITPDRTLIVRDSGIELWPHPLFIDSIVETLKSLAPTARRIAETSLGQVPSVPKKSAVAFSIAGPASDAFIRDPRGGSRFLYTDSGKRYEFKINSSGTIDATDLNGKSTPLNEGWSYTDLRIGKKVIPPPFDLIAASGGRIFAKAKGSNDFYIGTMDHMFIHASKDAAADALETFIPPFTVKLDPQFGMEMNGFGLLKSTDGMRTDSPMSERLTLYRHVMPRELMDVMIARMNPGVLQQVDSRPPLNVIGFAIRNLVMALGPLAEAFANQGFGMGAILPLILSKFKDEIDKEPPPEFGSAPPRVNSNFIVPVYEPVTYELPDGTRVSPPAIKYKRVLDIGVSHVHWFQQYDRAGGGELQPMLLSEHLKSVYRFFNGPVQDGDGFIDGTCNVYALVEHEQGYALLYQDEQWYVNQRWRLVDPADHEGQMGMTVASTLDNPGYEWNPATYWCPFRNGHINEKSRLAVAAHILLVTGDDPVRKVPLIYSINYGFTVMDRTWRYREYPAPTKYFDESIIEAGNATVRSDVEVVYPQTIRLREDMTIHIKGAGNVNGKVVAGRWYQRYLPADNAHVPSKRQLVAGKMPSIGYTHRWKFLPESAFTLADSFSHFGVYDTVDSRCQYYDVTPASAADAATLDAGGPGPWIDDARQLYISHWKFRYDVQRPGADPIDSPSLFNANTLLRIVRRGSRWIAMHWDKRDDDLLAFERLPRTVTLKNGTRTVRVAIGPHHQVLQPPMVRNAYMWLEPDGTAVLSFIAVEFESMVWDNVWRVRMAALKLFKDKGITRTQVVSLVDVTTTGGEFTPVGFDRYERRWIPTAAEMTALRLYCSPEGAAASATSIWFEDLVGHVSVPESIEWRPRFVSAIATPNPIFLRRPVEVIITARDSGTQQLLDGEVRVNNEVVARTGQRFTRTFELTVPEGGVPDPPKGSEPLESIPPVVTVLVKDYPLAQVDINFVEYSSNAAFVRQSVPTSMISGSSHQVSVTMRNTGTSTWTSGGTNPFGLGFQSSQIPQNDSTWGVSRLALPGPVAPGAEVTFTFSVIAQAPRTVSFRWRMVQEFIEWFGEFTPDVLVQVIGRTMLVSATPNPAPLDTLVSVFVRAVDSQTGAPVAGRVRINGIEVGDTNTAFNTTFRMQVIGVKPNFESIYPAGSVSAGGYASVPIDFGFPDI